MHSVSRDYLPTIVRPRHLNQQGTFQHWHTAQNPRAGFLFTTCHSMTPFVVHPSSRLETVRFRQGCHTNYASSRGATRGLKSRFSLRIPSWTTLPHRIVICDTLWSKGKRLQRFLAGLRRSISRREQHQGSNISHLILPLTAFDCLSSTATFHRLSTVDPRLCTWKW